MSFVKPKLILIMCSMFLLIPGTSASGESLYDPSGVNLFTDLKAQTIGDIVFIKSASSLESVPMKTCPVCKHKNLVDAKFCQRCGKTLEEKK